MPRPGSKRSERASGVATSSGPSGSDLADLPERVLVHWEGGLRFRGGREGGATVLLDGSKAAGPGAVDAVAVALAACSGQDVVAMLAKRRTPAEKLEIDVRYARVQATPRRLAALHLTFRVRTKSAPHHVERAARLAVEKYCSVASSLAPGVRITTSAEVEAP